MSDNFTASLAADSSADFTYSVADTTVTYPDGILMARGGGGTYDNGIVKTVAFFGVAGMYVEWYTRKNSSNSGCYAFSGLRKDHSMAETGVYGVCFSSLSRLEATITSTAITTSVTLDQWYKVKVLLKDNNTYDLYVDDVLIENVNPSTSLIGQALYLQLGAPYYTPKVGYKDVTVSDPREAVDSSACSDFTGWTSVATDGTVTVDSGRFKFAPTTTAGELAVYRGLVTGAAGDKISFDFQVGSHANDSILMGIVDIQDGALPGTETRVTVYAANDGNIHALRLVGGVATVFSGDKALGTYPSIHNVVLTILPNGGVQAWAKISTESLWTNLGSVDGSYNFASDLYFHVWGYRDTSGQFLYFDNYEWLQLPEAPTGGMPGSGAPSALMHNIIKRKR